MLHLLDTPHWRQGESRWDLPDTLPGWTLAFLSVQRDWVARERLCTLIWPDAGVAEAQHSLRVNLYRVRAILAGWARARRSRPSASACAFACRPTLPRSAR